MIDIRHVFEFLEFDSNLFGYHTSRLTCHGVTLEELSSVLGELRQRGCKLAYWSLKPGDRENQFAAILGGKLADEKITFRKALESRSAGAPDQNIVPFAGDRPNAQLVNLALQSGIFSRFKTDSHFQNNEFTKLYTVWIEKSVNHAVADEVFVYVEHGTELGLITVGVSGEAGTIGLFAVDEHARGKSIGTKLIQSSDQWFRAKRITRVNVVTQRANAVACSFYERQGFRIANVEHVYHFWL